MDAEHKVIYLNVPLSEYEYLHTEVFRLTNGWSDAEAQIAVLQDKLNWANVELTHRVGWEQRARELTNYADRHPCDHMPKCPDATQP